MPANSHFYCIFPVLKLFLNSPWLPFRPQNRGQKQGTVPAFTLLSPRVTHEEKSRRRGAREKTIAWCLIFRSRTRVGKSNHLRRELKVAWNKFFRPAPRKGDFFLCGRTRALQLKGKRRNRPLCLPLKKIGAAGPPRSSYSSSSSDRYISWIMSSCAIIVVASRPYALEHLCETLECSS